MTARRQATRPPLTLYRVELAAHELAGGRWRIPRLAVTVPGADEDDAAQFVVSLAYAKHPERIPPWRPLARESLQHVRVRRIGDRITPLSAQRKPAQRKPDRLAA